MNRTESSSMIPTAASPARTGPLDSAPVPPARAGARDEIAVVAIDGQHAIVRCTRINPRLMTGAHTLVLHIPIPRLRAILADVETLPRAA